MVFNDYFIKNDEVWCYALYACELPFYGFVDTRTPIRMSEHNFRMLYPAKVVRELSAGELQTLNLKDFFNETALIDNEIAEPVKEAPVPGVGDPNGVVGCHCEPYNDSELRAMIEAIEVPSIEGLASEEFVKNKIAEAELNDKEVDLSGLATKSEVQEIANLVEEKAEKVHEHEEYLKEHQDISHLALKEEIPNIEGLVNAEFVRAEIAAIEHPMYDDSELRAMIEGIEHPMYDDSELREMIAAIEIPDVPSVEGLASEEFVRAEIEAIEHPMYDDSELREMINAIEIPEVPSIEGLASEEFVRAEIATIEHPMYDDTELKERVEVLETINLETKPYIDKNGMLVLCGCPAVARGVGEEVHVVVRFFNNEEDKFVFTKEEFAKLRICMGYGAEGVGTKRNIVETTLELYDIDKVFIIDGGSQITGEIGTVNIIAERCNYIDGIQGARAMNGGERNIVHNFNVKVKDVKLIDTLYGGGNGYSVVWNSNILVEGETELNYLIAGGSNGYTNRSRIVMNDGHAKVMQGVNRGILNRAELILNGGKVDNFYLAGDASDASVTGVQHEAYVELNGGEIVKFANGTSGSQLFEGKIEGHLIDCNVLEGDVSVLEKVEKEPEVKFAFNEAGELEVTINGVKKIFVPKE